VSAEAPPPWELVWAPAQPTRHSRLHTTTRPVLRIIIGS
jgi:hypothetical protein